MSRPRGSSLASACPRPFSLADFFPQIRVAKCLHVACCVQLASPIYWERGVVKSPCCIITGEGELRCCTGAKFVGICNLLRDGMQVIHCIVHTRHGGLGPPRLLNGDKGGRHKQLECSAMSGTLHLHAAQQQQKRGAEAPNLHGCTTRNGNQKNVHIPAQSAPTLPRYSYVLHRFPSFPLISVNFPHSPHFP